MLGLDIAYMHAEFDDSDHSIYSFSHSGDMVGAQCPPKFKWFT